GRTNGPGERKAAAEPGGGSFAKCIHSLVHGIAAEFVEMGGQHGTDESRNPVLRLAHRETDGRHPGFDMVDELAQAHEWRAAKIGPDWRGRGRAFGGCH